MSVTMGFIPNALIDALARKAAGMISCRQTSAPQLLSQDGCDELTRLLYPNLYAARRGIQTPQATRETAQAECLTSFVRETFAQDLDFAQAAAESLAGELLDAGFDADRGFAFLYQNCGIVLARPEENAALELWILGAPDETTAASIAEQFEGEYQRLVLDHVHAALLQRSAEYGMTLESEEIQADRSVVLTFTV